MSPVPDVDIIPHSRPTLDPADAAAVAQLIETGYVGRGNTTTEFEGRVKELVQRSFALAVSSGSAALHLALLALGVQSGDPVVLPALLCRAVLNVVQAIGAEPVLVDVDPDDLTMSAESVRQVLSLKPKVIIVPHMFGAPADLANLLAFGIPVLEDAASSLGATYHARPVGGFGAASVFSFGSTKMLTTGQGGMVLVDDSATFERLVGLCDYDGARVDQRGPAYNYQFSDMQAALGLAQLNRLPQFMDRRRTIAGIYRDALGDLPGLRLPAARAGAEHGYYRFVIQVPGNSDKLVRALQQRAIDARSSVAHFLYDYIEASPADFPQCEAVRHSLISLPIYPTLTDEQAQHIGQSCRVAWTERARVSL